MKILVTGFEPFGGESVNPSWEAVKLLKTPCEKREICVEYARAGEELLKAINEVQPEIVICVGQAGGRQGLSIECCALNRDHALAPDNAGEIRKYAPISKNGANALFTNCDVPKIVDAINETGIEARASYSAGTYVCNHIYYTLLSNFAGKGLFIHVPYADTQKNDAPTMSIESMAKGIDKAIEEIIE